MTITVYNYHGLRYIRLSELPDDEQVRLTAWLFGQTSASLPELDPEDIVYLEDYRRWQHESTTGDGSAWD